MKRYAKCTALLLSVLLILSVLSACGGSGSRTPTLNDLNQSTNSASGSLTDIVPSAITTTTASTDSSNDPVTFSYSTYLTKEGHFEGVTALDYVTLPAYEGISIPADIHTISDEDVDEQIDSLRDSYVTYGQITDRSLENGDTVNIDYVGTIDGVEFSGGSTGGAGTIVTIGVTNYIDDFLEQLIGHKPGETIEVEVTFPEDYGQEDLNGKDAVFTTTINYIQGEAIYPEINDEFVAETFNNWTTVEELREGIRDQLRTNAIAGYIETYLVENTTYTSIPQAIYNYQASSLIYYYETNAAAYGVDLTTFLNAMVGVESVPALLEAEAEYLQHYSRYCLSIQAIAEDSNFTVTDEMLEDYMSQNYSASLHDQLTEFYGEPYLRYVALNDLILSQMIDTCVLE